MRGIRIAIELIVASFLLAHHQEEDGKMYRLLKGHTSRHFAYVVSLSEGKGEIRYWVETAQSGPYRGHQRLMSQMTRGTKTYEAHHDTPWYGMLVMALDESTGKIVATGVDPTSTPNEFREFKRRVGGQIDGSQRAVLRNFEDFSRRAKPEWWNETASLR